MMPCRCDCLRQNALRLDRHRAAGGSLQHLDIRLSGASHAKVQADQTIAAQLSGASGLTYKGTPRFTKQDTTGASTIQPAS